MSTNASAQIEIGRKNRLIVRVFFALLFVVFTCIYPYIGALNNPNENVRTYMTMAIVEQHTFRIDQIVQRHGWVNDMAAAPDKVTGERHPEKPGHQREPNSPEGL